MTESNQNFTINAGDSIVIEDSVKSADGTDRDITGYSAQFTIAKYRGGEVVQQHTESDQSVSVGQSDNSVVTVSLSPSDTEDLGGVDPSGEEVYYEIELTDQSGNDYTVTTGTITVLPSY